MRKGIRNKIFRLKFDKSRNIKIFCGKGRKNFEESTGDFCVELVVGNCIMGENIHSFTFRIYPCFSSFLFISPDFDFKERFAKGIGVMSIIQNEFYRPFIKFRFEFQIVQNDQERTIFKLRLALSFLRSIAG
jgi:hypothetical protein